MSQLMTNRPTITIGMPVRNCEATLAQAIRSLQLQTYQDWRLIMIDDGSSDGTLKAAQQFDDKRITILSDGVHRGLPARLNQILTLAQSKYFARMDSDDIAYPQRLERQVRYIEEHPKVDLVGTGIAVFGQEGYLLGKRQVPREHAAICHSPHAGFFLAHPTFLGKLEWFRRYQYRETAVRCEDQDLLLRSYRASQFGNVPEILLGYREETINPQKIFTARWYYGIAVAREFARRGEYGTVAWALLLQSAKAALDWVAITSGLHHKLLKHRARRVSALERSEWHTVWEMVNAPQYSPIISESSSSCVDGAGRSTTSASLV